MIILAICVPFSVFVLFLVAVISYRVTKRVKKTYDTTAADDGKDSKYICMYCLEFYRAFFSFSCRRGGHYNCRLTAV